MKKHINEDPYIYGPISTSCISIFLDTHIKKNLGEKPIKNNIGVPKKIKGYFRSKSHTNKTGIIAIHSKEIGVDCETIKIRDEKLFTFFPRKERELFGEKNRDTFYILRTSKESIFKTCGLSSLSLLSKIQITHSGKESGIIGNFFYDHKLRGLYNNQKYIVYSSRREDIQIAISIFDHN